MKVTLPIEALPPAKPLAETVSRERPNQMNAILSDYELTTAVVQRHQERHAKAQSMLWQCAGFTFNRDTGRYEIEVCGLIVARPKKLADVKTFCAMHNREF